MPPIYNNLFQYFIINICCYIFYILCEFICIIYTSMYLVVVRYNRFNSPITKENRLLLSFQYSIPYVQKYTHSYTYFELCVFVSRHHHHLHHIWTKKKNKQFQYIHKKHINIISQRGLNRFSRCKVFDDFFFLASFIFVSIPANTQHLFTNHSEHWKEVCRK